MLKNATYKEKFAMLEYWIPHILDSIKKDLKNEHLKKDWQFCKQYLQGKSINKLTLEDLVEAYTQALQKSENAEALAEFISNRWLLKHGELYSYFESQLSKINPNFSEIDAIDPNRSREIVKGSIELSGPVRTYLFSVINSVVFPEEVYKELSSQARQAENQEEEEEKFLSEKMTLESMQRSYELQMARLVDKYEKKLLGMHKKYIQDTESLKKQLSQLQRKASQN